jgi:hypothetical protein
MTQENVVRLHESSNMLAALSYAELGWHILPAWWVETDAGTGALHCACANSDCKSPGKHPIGKIAPMGQNSATSDEITIRNWWNQYPDANIAVYLEPSELCAVDIDPRNGGIQTIEDIEAKFGPLVSDLMQFTGGGGEHRVFHLPRNIALPGKLGTGVDIKANGYIMVEPSNHISGSKYSWEASSDPRKGVIASPMPDWMRDLSGAKSFSASEDLRPDRPIRVTEQTKIELLQALAVIPADERDTWHRVGMALHSTGEFDWGFRVWSEWSAQSPKYDPVDQIRVWRSFKARGLDGITYRSIFGMARELGLIIHSMQSEIPVLVNDKDPNTDIPDISSVAVKKRIDDYPIDSTLVAPPGILKEVVDWVNASSPKPQPQFAVQTALAFAATVLGRRFCTNHGNWPSLFLLNIGLSASGKEYAKTAVEKLLEACGLSSLIGPSGFSSDSGLLSTLFHQPNHVAIVDEFHRVLEQASVKGNARAQGMLRALIEVWGRTDGTMRSIGYSTVGMSAKEARAVQERSVCNPALTLLTMAVPSFWETIGSAAARDGFLNRFLIVETTIGRQVGQFTGGIPVPQLVVDWAARIRSRYTGIVDLDCNPMRVTAVIVPISSPAMALFDAFARECIQLMDEYEDDGLAEMFGRSNEISMKLALILALAREDVTVSASDAEWATCYVRTYALRAVQRLKTFMADGLFEAAKKQVLNLLLKAGERGMTPNEVNRRSRLFRGMTQRQQTELLSSMAYLGQVQQIQFPSSSGRGRPRFAWVAIEEPLDIHAI